jgi:hypothetical protein
VERKLGILLQKGKRMKFVLITDPGIAGEFEPETFLVNIPDYVKVQEAFCRYQEASSEFYEEPDHDNFPEFHEWLVDAYKAAGAAVVECEKFRWEE